LRFLRIKILESYNIGSTIERLLTKKMLKTYSCGICKTKPDQISHHKLHLGTGKHKDKRELFELRLSKIDGDNLILEYGTNDVVSIVKSVETIIEDKKAGNTSNHFIDKMEKVIQTESGKESEEESGNSNYTSDQEILKKMEEYNLISNREALKDKIHHIHNYMRNHGAGYGMNALKVFNILYGLKKIEENGLLEKVGLSDVCRFSGLIELANGGRMEKLAETIYGEVLDALYGHPLMKSILFYEIPKNMKSDVLATLVREIDSITKIEKKYNVQLSGKIYEYFIGRDESAISELGAYFTDRHIVNYIYDKLNPEVMEDGTIHEMIDMFGGSGGFTTSYIHKILQSDVKVNWETELCKVFHFDMNEDVIKSAALEFFCMTGTLPTIGKHMGYKNSFKDEFYLGQEQPKKFHYIVSNPPYGGDKKKKSGEEAKQDKIKAYIQNELKELMKDSAKNKSVIELRNKQLKMIEMKEKESSKEEEEKKVCLSSSSDRIQAFARKHKLKANDKEAVSLIQLMDMLAPGGTTVGVLKEGVFFDKKYSDIRKCLIKNFNVREVISVPADSFENTKTKTSIIFFDNTEEKTSTVRFSELIVEKYQEDKFEEINGVIVLTENKDDIARVYDSYISEATVEEILTNKTVSLNGKEYNKKEIVPGDDYKMVRLGDICEYQNGYAFKSSEYVSEGVPLITISHIKDERIVFSGNHYIKEDIRYKNVEIMRGDIIISLTGKKPNMCSIAINQHTHKQYLNQRCAILRNFTGITSQYFMCVFQSYISGYINKNIGGGTNQDNVSILDILNIKIPIPKSPAKMKEWVDKISLPFNKRIETEERIKSLEKMVKTQIEEITTKEECEEVELGKICNIENGYAFKSNDYKKSGIPLLSIKHIPDFDFNEDTHYIDESEKYQKFLINKNDILIALSGNTTGKFGLFTSGVKAYCNQRVGRIRMSDKKYVFFVFYLFQVIDLSKRIINSSTQSAQPNISSKDIEKMMVKFPKNRDLIKALDTIFEEIELLQTQLKESETQYKQYITDLSKEAIKGETTTAPLTKSSLSEHDGISSSTGSAGNPETSSVISKSSTKSKTSTKSSTSSVGIPCGAMMKNGSTCQCKGKAEFNGRCGKHKNA
jgi:restriction endonuclease S subunit